ncbi:hypothetical protein LguiA_033574 [Lonicera macranthoides]
MINFAKSFILFNANTPPQSRVAICDLFGVQECSNHGKYLGAPSLIGCNKADVFAYVKEKACRRMFGWRNKNISRAGKEVLLKSVIQAVPSYMMSVFLLPLSLCDELERMMSSFWWEKERQK